MQGDQTSEWFGMPARNAPLPTASFRLSGGTPAYLEATIDPAAHGEAGLGPIRRAVLLKTAAGQELSVELTAVVYR